MFSWSNFKKAFCPKDPCQYEADHPLPSLDSTWGEWFDVESEEELPLSLYGMTHYISSCDSRINSVRVRMNKIHMAIQLEVTGGDPLVIAEALYKSRPLGVLTVGTVGVTVKSELTGISHHVNFDYVYK